MGVSMFLAGGLSRAALNHPDKAGQYGAAAASFTFIFTAGFGATWLTIPWLYPAEIFPLQIRAKGNAWGVVGWCIGNGWTVSLFLPFSLSSSIYTYFTQHEPQVLLLPTMFKHIKEKVFYIFGAVNFLTIPIVWALYPESNQRTLEEMDLLFATDSWWNWDAESTFARLREENPELVQAARAGSMVAGDPETGPRRKSTRGPSLVPGLRMTEGSETGSGSEEKGGLGGEAEVKT